MSVCEVERSAAPVLLQHVSVAYGERIALKDVSLNLSAGSKIAVVGPNGSGKSTLLKTIIGMTSLTQGQVRLFGQQPTNRRNSVAYVPQREAVNWHFPVTVADVVMMGRINYLRLGRFAREADKEVIEKALARVGMAVYAETPISDLSGGQQQRVFLARMLAQDAPLLLLDEPFNQVDAQTQHLLLQLLEELVAEGRTIIVTTHDLNVASRHFDQVILLNQSVVAFGPPKDVLQPHLLQKAFIGQGMSWQPFPAGVQ